jgi:hypothetical protein
MSARGSSQFLGRATRASSAQIVEQPLRLLQIERVEAFGKPTVHRSEKLASFIPLALIAPEPPGEIDRSGKISRCGDKMMRVMLYEAAQSMLCSKNWSWLKAWAMQIARRRGVKKAIVALARRLAVIMHRIWVDGTEFRWTREQAAAVA